MPCAQRRYNFQRRLMPTRDQWLDLARDLDWELSYVSEEEAFPEVLSGRPFLPRAAWRGWDEPYRTTYPDYVSTQAEKDASVYAVRDVVGKPEDYARLPPEWKSALKLHAA